LFASGEFTPAGEQCQLANWLQCTANSDGRHQKHYMPVWCDTKQLWTQRVSNHSRLRPTRHHSRPADRTCTSGQCTDQNDDTGTAAPYTRLDLLNAHINTGIIIVSVYWSSWHT